MQQHEGNDITIQDFISEQAEEASEVVRFYSGSTVFVTGSTGFMGQVLLEKLLRSCPDVDKVYVLMRPKKEKSLEERFKEQFEGPLYERLRSERPGFQLKVYPVAGDCTARYLGLSEDVRDKLKDVNVIFHVAATVRFDEKMRVATAINVQSTIDLLNMAREMKELKAFVHVSTAYSYPQNKVIEEKFYSPDLSPDKLINIVNNMDDNMLESVTPQLITSWPNTYAFTKAVGEKAVEQYGEGLPVVMMRPSMVISTAKEPLSGWINNVYGPTGVVAGAGLGLLHILHADENKLADVVPVDMAINALMTVAWHFATQRTPTINNEKKQTDEDKEIPVYNFVSSVDQPITWGKFMEYNARAISIPSVKCVWYYEFTLTSNPYVYYFYMTLLHLLPALLVDMGCRLLGKKPFLWDAYKKIHKFTKVITHFCTNEWRFKNDNVRSLILKMNTTDQRIFDFNLSNLQWEQYFHTYMRGLRVYLVKDPLETLPEARVKYQRLKLANLALKWGVRALLFWTLLRLLRLFLY